MLEYSHAAKDTNRRTGLSFSKLNRLQSKLTLIEGKHSECTNSAEAESDKKIERFRQVSVSISNALLSCFVIITHENILIIENAGKYCKIESN